ncbi:MAG TPA: DUF2782 domain-containing protein [Oleiagrimonas sp.]|nr:DUF2782 domain-containing protein [Oleiagrimonas sp.]
MKAPVMYLACALGAILFFGAPPSKAQTAPAATLTVLPPPSINDPGAKPAPQTKMATPATTGAPAADGMAIPIPPLPGGTGKDARGESPPTVKVTKHEGKLIEEYYQGGQLYMVQVHPKHGVPYTYFVDKSHKLTRSPGAPPVNPVLYTILEWGGSSSGTSGDSQ